MRDSGVTGGCLHNNAMHACLAVALLASASSARAEPTAAAEVIDATAAADTPETEVATETATETTTEPEPGLLDGLRFWITATEGYRHRHTLPIDLTVPANIYADTQNASDQDLRFLLDLGLSGPDGELGGDGVMAMWVDLDGVNTTPRPRSYGSVRDNESGVWVDVYSLAGHYTNRTWLESLKAGRLSTEHGAPVIFDGASVTIRPFITTATDVLAVRSLEFFLFGGRTAHFYELDDELFEDWIGSAGVQVRPLSDLRISLDYRLLAEDSAAADIDHNYGLTAWYRPIDAVFLKAYGRGVNDALASLGTSTRLIWEPWTIGLDSDVDFQLSVLGELNELNDPYFAVLGESQPRVRWKVDAWKRFDTIVGDWGLHLGWGGREPLEGESGAFNRSYGRIYLMAEVEDLILPGLSASASLEYHHDGSIIDDGLLTVGGSAGYDHGWIGGEIGSYYQRFKYVYYVDIDELQNVRTVYLSAHVEPLDGLKFKARYLFERSDRDLHTIILSFTQAFEVGG